MALIPKQLVKAALLTASPVAVYNAPANTTANLHSAMAVNPTASPVVVDLYVAPAGGTPAVGQKIANRTVPVGVSPIADVANVKIEPGYSLYAVSTAAGASLNVFGTEYVPE